MNSKVLFVVLVFALFVFYCQTNTIEHYAASWFPRIYLKDIRLTTQPWNKVETPEFQTFDKTREEIASWQPADVDTCPVESEKIDLKTDPYSYLLKRGGNASL